MVPGDLVAQVNRMLLLIVIFLIFLCCFIVFNKDINRISKGISMILLYPLTIMMIAVFYTHFFDDYGKMISLLL